uniref:Uncharacterized protein n=1 Tax=Caenorhabditis tropicalis TaxID=1561998 RepID=A0A1I7TN85_9PELO
MTASNEKEWTSTGRHNGERVRTRMGCPGIGSSLDDRRGGFDLHGMTRWRTCSHKNGMPPALDLHWMTGEEDLTSTG